MKKFFKFGVLWTLVACMVIQTIFLPKASAAEADQSATILFTHDLHDNLLPFKSEQNGTITNIGGYARLQTVINTEKEKASDALLVDAGDFSMGTPFQTIYKSDAPELKILGQMGYDAVTFGNHEFDYRAQGLADSLNAAKSSGAKLPQIVQANVTYPADKEGNLTPSLTKLKQAMSDYGVKEYTVIERNGIKIGIFGIMGPESASMAPMSEVVFADYINNAKRIVKILKEQEKADLIVCLSHTGTKADKSKSEDEILAKQVPEINVIISGHTHTTLSEPIITGKTIIGSAGEYGKNLGVIKVTRQPDKSWKLDRYELMPINESVAENQEIAKQVAQFKDIVQKEYFDKFNLSYDEVIAKAPFSFPTTDEMGGRHAESTLGNLISDAYVYAVRQAEGDNYTPVDAAIVPVGTVRGTFFKGDITTADAFSVSSLGIGADKMSGYPLISIYLTGKELKAVCEVDASVTPIMNEAQLYISGLKYTFNPNRLIFNKLESCSLIKSDELMAKINDDNIKKIDDKKLYRIVAGLYSAQMLSVVGKKTFGLLKIVPKTKDGTPVTDYEAQIVYDNHDGNKSEVKEWYAVVSYLKSFDKSAEGVPTIPQYYNEVQGRKVVDSSKNILVLISDPNGIALTVYGIITVLLILIIIRVIVKKIKKRKGRK